MKQDNLGNRLIKPLLDELLRSAGCIREQGFYCRNSSSVCQRFILIRSRFADWYQVQVSLAILFSPSEECLRESVPEHVNTDFQSLAGDHGPMLLDAMDGERGEWADEDRMREILNAWDNTILPALEKYLDANAVVQRIMEIGDGPLERTFLVTVDGRKAAKRWLESKEVGDRSATPPPADLDHKY